MKIHGDDLIKDRMELFIAKKYFFNRKTINRSLKVSMS